MQLVLYNKQAPLKEQSYNGFPQRNILFKFSQINHRPLNIMNGYKKCCEINAVFFTYDSLQVLSLEIMTLSQKKWMPGNDVAI